VATTIQSAASKLLQEQINNTPKTALGKPTRATNIPNVGLSTPPKPLGRPVGQTSRIEEFKQKLVTTSGDAIISKLIQIALHDGNPGQMSALKMCVDRVLPISHFDKAVNGNQSPTISINISGLTNSTATISGDIGSGSDGDIIDVEPVAYE
jgi:hypothetical protein